MKCKQPFGIAGLDFFRDPLGRMAAMRSTVDAQGALPR